MAEAMVERQTLPRFYCYKCNVEFDHVSQEYICPYCSGGFVEQVENEEEDSRSTTANTSESDSDMMTFEDPDDASLEDPGHSFHDLAFLMSNGRIRGVRGGFNAGNTENLLQHILMAWTGEVGQGASPVVVVGTSPGDYVVGGESFDAVVTQLLGQLEGTGPPPLSADGIAAIPSVEVTQEQADSKLTCSICWEAFDTGESVRKLECDHMYHGGCIEPWLKLHGTCPVCRRSLIPEGQRPITPVLSAPWTLQPATGPPGAPPQPSTFRTFIADGSRDIPPRLTALLMRAARGGGFSRTRGSTPGRWVGPYRLPRTRPAVDTSDAPLPTTRPEVPDEQQPTNPGTNDSARSPTAGYSMDIDFD